MLDLEFHGHAFRSCGGGSADFHHCHESWLEARGERGGAVGTSGGIRN